MLKSSYPHSEKRTSLPWALFVVLLLLATAMSGVVFVAYQYQAASTKQAALARLVAITSLKVHDISDWLSERRTNALAVPRSPILIEALAHWRETGSREEFARVSKTLDSVRDAYDFSDVVLYDVAGRRIIGDNAWIAADIVVAATAQSRQSRSLAFVDLHPAPTDSAARLGYVAPVMANSAPDAEIVAFMYFELRASDYLFSRVKDWPLPSQTGGAVLLRREGDEIVFLSSMNRLNAAPLSNRFSMNDRTTPAVLAFEFQQQTFETLDYRGVPVLAAAKSVAGTPWMLVAKEDSAEALASSQIFAVVSAIVLVGIFGFASAVVVAMWQRLRLRHAAAEIRAKKELEVAATLYQETFDHAAVGIAHLDKEGRWLRVNPRFCEIVGYDREELLTKTLHDITPPEDTDPTTRYTMRVGQSDTFRADKRYIRKDGSLVWVNVTSALMRDAAGDPDYYITVILDISGRKKAEERLRQAAAVFTSTHEGIIVTDTNNNIIAVNPAFTTITGYSEHEVLGKSTEILQSNRRDVGAYEQAWRSIGETGFWQGEAWKRRKDGDDYPEWLTISAVRSPSGEITNYVRVFTDITRVKQTEARLHQQAHYDALTGMPNRLEAQILLDAAIAKSRATGTQGAVLFVDLDRFRIVNDSLGHAAGDELLILVAQRLRASLPETNIVARPGEDEFIVVIENLPSASHAAANADRLIAECGTPFVLSGGQDIYISASVGISIFPDDADTPGELLQRADTAVVHAKEAGGGTHRYYTPKLTETASEHLALAARLRRAIDRDEFELHYQPLVSVAEFGQVKGLEALIRWRDGDGLIPPDRFIPLAENTGLIVPIGDWVLRTACRQMMAWRSAGVTVETMAVNISPRQFWHSDLAARVRAILDETGLPPHMLELEITEGALMKDGADAVAKLFKLKQLGVRLAIDDFGTGQSSLANLKRFPIDKLKIDRSFVNEIPGDHTSTEIAIAVINLGKALRVEVLAEGVETAAQLEFLRDRGCDTVQGYLICRPMPRNDVAEFVRLFSGKSMFARAEALRHSA